ncbi:hypothetical protein SB748_27495 [Rhizobium sp. SIMBA_035]
MKINLAATMVAAVLVMSLMVAVNPFGRHLVDPAPTASIKVR